MKLAEIASGIYQHLKRFEADPEINKRDNVHRILPYYCVNAWDAGSKVKVKYVSFQGEHSLTKKEALDYLTWLNQGGIGTHWKQQKEQA